MTQGALSKQAESLKNHLLAEQPAQFCGVEVQRQQYWPAIVVCQRAVELLRQAIATKR